MKLPRIRIPKVKLPDLRALSFLGIKRVPRAPWKKYYNNTKMIINTKDESIYDFAYNRLERYGYHRKTAIKYFGKNISYNSFFYKIDDASKAFKTLGVEKFDVVSIISANVPEALISFYALNKIGAVSNMLHPLLSENEIKNSLNKYRSSFVVVLDVALDKLNNILDQTKVEKVIVISADNSMPLYMKLVYPFVNKNKPKTNIKNNDKYIKWSKFIEKGLNYGILRTPYIRNDDPALILESGGSTGSPKGIVLSQGNINAETIAIIRNFPKFNKEDVFLGIMPIFHGFGLEVSINDALSVGATVVLIPTFKAGEFDKLIKKYKPTILVGVPTLFEALTTNKGMDGVDLSRLKYVVAGGDSLNKERVKSINKFLKDHGSEVGMLQGYGMTEAVAAVSVDSPDDSHPGTIGIPLPGLYVGIFEPNTDNELPHGEVGEICICGPTVMLGYYNDEEETNLALKHHRDGNIWLHSGDLGTMDDDGFLTYTSRLKRMIISSGYNVYPSQIEEVLMLHNEVLTCSVIGVPHPYKMEVPKAYIVLTPGIHNRNKIKKDLEELCKLNLAKYAIPKEFEFRRSLPKTMVGKVDFRALQEENRRVRKHGKTER